MFDATHYPPREYRKEVVWHCEMAMEKQLGMITPAVKSLLNKLG